MPGYYVTIVGVGTEDLGMFEKDEISARDARALILARYPSTSTVILTRVNDDGTRTQIVSSKGTKA